MHEQYTVRVYNSKFVDKIENAYLKCKSLFPTKNPFLVECLKRGIEDVERDLFKDEEPSNLNGVYSEISKTLNKLDKLIKLSEKSAKENIANLTINQKLLSCIYNLALGISEENPRSKDYVEAGIYDELPERLSILLEKLVDNIV